MRYIISISVVLLMLSCSKNAKKNTEDLAVVPVFFDLKTLVQQDIQDLNRRKCAARKTGTVNDKTAEAILDTADWKRELEAIAAADINKSAWIPHIKCDSIIGESGKLSLHYSTQRANIPIRQMNVSFDSKGAVEKVYIERLSKNLIFESGQTITYFPGKSFEATGYQKALFMKAQSFKISSQFECQP